MRLIIVTLLTMLTGVAVAFGIASLIGLVWSAAKIPVFLILSVAWLWIGWQYAKARDRGQF
jgi:membrane protein implicated in regulation of membrane protease activity